MQSSHDPTTDLSHTAPFSTPLPSTDENLLFPLASVVPAELDPLITQTAKKLTEVINDFKRKLDERDGYSATKHQREVGTGYFDLVAQIIADGKSSTTALDGSTEAEQFR